MEKMLRYFLEFYFILYGIGQLEIIGDQMN